jgi:hypothetical protein
MSRSKSTKPSDHLCLGNLVHPHIVRPKLSRDRSAGTSRASEGLSPLPVSGAETGNISEVERQSCGTIGSYETNDNAIAQSSGPVWVELAAHGRRLA